jgi:hypothetical protein
MQTESDLTRIVRSWLRRDEHEAADRVLDNVLGLLDATPQRPPWWPARRLPYVNTQIRVAMAAAAVVIGAVIGINVIPRIGGVSGAASPTPIASPVPTTPASGTLAPPAALQATWVGPPRTIPGLTSDRYRFSLTASSLDFPDDIYQHPVLVSDATAPAAGQLQLTTTDSTVGCQPGDVGRYTWSLSPSGSRLTLVATSDACQERSAALAGDWFRVGCKNTDSGCLGDLQDAGTYSSQYFTPLLAAFAPWRPTWGALTYTVPAGWANSSDWPNTFSLTPSTDYAKETSQGPPAGVFNEVDLYRDAAASAQNGQCSKAIVATVPQTVDGLVGYIRGLKSVVSTSPAAITVDGHPAKWIDVKVAPTWTATCPGVVPAAPANTFLAYDGSSNTNDYQIGLTGKEQQRLIFVDLGGGIVGLIVIDSTDPARFGQLVADAMPIIASFSFK